jgi:hypothetical protein
MARVSILSFCFPLCTQEGDLNPDMTNISTEQTAPRGLTTPKSSAKMFVNGLRQLSSPAAHLTRAAFRSLAREHGAPFFEGKPSAVIFGKSSLLRARIHWNSPAPKCSVKYIGVNRCGWHG